jgi:tetratricopeptide (TPR) repeat protein
MLAALVLLMLPRLALAGQRPAAPNPAIALAARYSTIVRAYQRGDAAAPERLRAWSIDDARTAAQRFGGIALSLEQQFADLAALDEKAHASGVTGPKYDEQRTLIVSRIQVAYDGLTTGNVAGSTEFRLPDVSPETVETVRRILANGDWKPGLPPPVVSLLRAAAGLHTAVAVDAWGRGAVVEMANHLECATAYFGDLLAPLDPAYVQLWCRTAATLLASSERQGLALREINRCGAWVPVDAQLLLARGSTHDSAEVALRGQPSGATLPDWPGGKPDAAREIAQARADYLAALAANPDLAEARIRLARLQLSAGDRDAAASTIEAVDAKSLPGIAGYWAWLVSGAVAEAQGLPGAAEARYRAALAAYPQAQSAAIALSHVLARRDRGAAVSVLRSHLGPTSHRTFTSDPWWMYRMGQAWRVPEWADQIARRSQQPRSHQR